MDLRHIAILSTTDIQAEHPAYPGQAPVPGGTPGRRVPGVWSTGRLEQALRLGLDVFVCSIRPAFGPHDRWWRAMVPPDKVFCADGLLRPFRPSEAERLLIEPWRRLYAALGVRWDPSLTHERDARARLVDRFGAVDGATLSGTLS